MPGQDGYELIRELRRRETAGDIKGSRGTHITAIAHTSFSRDEDRQQARQAGFDAHCAKPLKPLVLVREVRRLLDAG